MKKKIIIDTDMGMDDIIAISMLTSSQKIDVIGISTVFGLVKPEIGAANISKIFGYCGIKKEICIGTDRALRKNSWNDSFPKQDIRNSTRLDFLKRPVLNTDYKDTIVSDNVEDWIFQKVCKYPDKISILCLGPLSNTAKTLLKYGENFENRITELVIMGGAISVPGNVPPIFSSEYNFFLDPNAASLILTSKIPIRLVSLDGAKQVPANSNSLKNILNKSPTNKSGKIIKEILINNRNDFKYFYDPLAASILINPLIASFSNGKSINVIQSSKYKGKTIISDGKNKNVRIIKNVNSKSFYMLFKNVM